MLRVAAHLGLRLRPAGSGFRLARLASTTGTSFVPLRDPELANFAPLQDLTNFSTVPGRDSAKSSWVHDLQSNDLTTNLLTDQPAFIDNVPGSIVQAIEPSLSSLGLAKFTPPGVLQSCLEFFHVGMDMPWWGAIVAGTVCVRIIIFPLVVIAQRNAAKMHNNMPEMMTIQLKMTQARMANNREEVAKYGVELSNFMKEKGANPFKNMLAPLAQFPFFLSFFWGLRSMAECPVESMKTGGIYWFENLTVPDPIYMLPFLTSVTMYFVIEFGADSGKLPENMKKLKNFMRLFPLITFPITCQFPAAMLCYWVSTNFISLIQVGVLKIPSVRGFLKIPETINHPPGSIPKMPSPFSMNANDSWANIKITKKMEERNEIDKLLKERDENRRVKRTTSRRSRKDKTEE